MQSALAPLALAALLLGCQTGDDRKPEQSGPPPNDRPAAIGREEMATVDAMAQFIAGLRGAVEGARGDCDRMAAAIAPVMERGKPAIEKARALEKKLEADREARQWVEAYVEQKSGDFGAISTGIGNCTGHPGVQQALAGFIQ